MLIGHQKQWQFLKKSAELGRLSHAYLFIGQEKLGKKRVALEWISQLFGQPCSKFLLEGNPDFILITPLQKEIQIEQIRNLNWRLSLKAFSAPFKGVIIDQAHLMNPEAQNCFLKTLEEPKGETLLILVTEYPEFLFPTIRSRTEIIKFYPLPKKEIENYLREQGIEEKKVEIISQISGGKPGVAIDFLNQPKKLKEREVLLNEIIRLTKSDLTSRFQYAQKIAESPELKEILNSWLYYFRENFLSNLNKGDRDSTLVSFRLKQVLWQIQNTISLISFTNVNPRLALEILMLQLPTSK